MASAGEVVAGTGGEEVGSGWKEGWLEMERLQGVAWRQWV